MPKEGFDSNETISRDGSLVTFTAEKEGTSQLTSDGTTRTRPGYLNRRDPTNRTPRREVRIHHPRQQDILFTTTSPLVDGDVNGETDIYMYTDAPDPAHESNLTLISSGEGIYGESSANPSEAFLGASDDGSIVYYQDNKWNQGQIWQWKDGQGARSSSFPMGLTNGAE